MEFTAQCSCVATKGLQLCSTPNTARCVLGSLCLVLAVEGPGCDVPDLCLASLSFVVCPPCPSSLASSIINHNQCVSYAILLQQLTTGNRCCKCSACTKC